jgi:ceramide glucosyltransferase
MMQGLALLATLLALAGIGQALAGWRAVRRFAADPGLPEGTLPPLTLLKPLHGDEPMLEAALASVCAQDYPQFQVVFGVQDPNDAAIAVVRRLQARFADRAIDLVIDPTPHGANRKVANLINMLPAARHDHLVIADSDLHCAPDYLRRVAAEFAGPDVGLVVTLYAGLAANASLAGRLGASAINHGFLPGALMSRRLGREDCLGATMALRRDTLARIGGFEALVPHLADDNVLGQLVRAQGLRIRMAASVPATTVPEATLDALFRHELRWSRTILSLVPVAFALSAIQYPIFWALLAWALSAAIAPLWCGAALVLLAWLVRALAARGIDRALGLVGQHRATPVPIWLLPLRDILSIAIVLASYSSDRVEWRGQIMHTHPAEPAPQGTVSR